MPARDYQELARTSRLNDTPDWEGVCRNVDDSEFYGADEDILIGDDVRYDFDDGEQAALDSIDGFDFGDVASIGKNVFGGVHTAGKAAASAFGFGSLAQGLESLEASAGLLPDWAISKDGSVTATVINNPDWVVVVRQEPTGKLNANGMKNIQTVAIKDGRRFPGNGYKRGDKLGTTFSFGYDAPSAVELIDKNGKKTSVIDAKQVLFLGGSENIK